MAANASNGAAITHQLDTLSPVAASQMNTFLPVSLVAAHFPSGLTAAATISFSESPPLCVMLHNHDR